MDSITNSTLPQPALDRLSPRELSQLKVVEAPGTAAPLSWREISTRVAQQLAAPAQLRGAEVGSSAAARTTQLSELLKLQVEVSRYQLRVEMLAKVAESAVASLRRLQQPQ
jgi:hypothetical protein